MSVRDGHISLTVSQTDLRVGMWLAHGTKSCILDFEDFSLRFSKEDYLRRPSSRGGVSFHCCISLSDRPTPGQLPTRTSEKYILPTGTALVQVNCKFPCSTCSSSTAKSQIIILFCFCNN